MLLMSADVLLSHLDAALRSGATAEGLAALAAECLAGGAAEAWIYDGFCRRDDACFRAWIDARSAQARSVSTPLPSNDRLNIRVIGGMNPSERKSNVTRRRQCAD
jgi:hypothetical protein